MIAIDALEQMDAEAFELIGADTARHGFSGGILEWRVIKPQNKE